MTGTRLALPRSMTIEDIAEQSRLAEGAYYAAAHRCAPETRRLKRIADSWEEALVAALMVRDAIERALASGDPAAVAGIPDSLQS